MQTEPISNPAPAETTPATPAPATPTPAPNRAKILDAACDITAFASKDETRHVLNGICLRPAFVEATDGKQLVRVPYPAFDPADLPSTLPVDQSCQDGLIIPTEAAKAAFKAMPKRQAMPVLNTVLATSQPKLDWNLPELKLSSTDLNSVSQANVKPVDGTWPNTQQVWPTQAPTLSVAFDPALLGQICAYAAKHGRQDTQPSGAKSTSLRLDFIDNLSPLRWSVRLADGRLAEGLLMPMRLPGAKAKS